MKGQTEKLTDAQLSKKLGGCQKAESIGMLLGILCVVSGCILMFVKRDIILICVLVFVGVALFLLVAKPAQTKKKALLQQQLGGYFRAELTRMFGVEPAAPALPIDRAYLKAAKLSAVDFTECTVTDFHEGEHKGLRFSAANVELRRTVEEKSGPDNDNWMTRTETLFRGIVVRCKDICDPALDIALNDMFRERKKDDITEPPSGSTSPLTRRMAGRRTIRSRRSFVTWYRSWRHLPPAPYEEVSLCFCVLELVII